MATFKPSILKHQERSDGTYNVKIRVTHKRVVNYIPTDYYVGARQLSKSFEIKDRFLLSRLNELIDRFHDKIVGMGDNLEFYSPKELTSFLEKKVLRKTDEAIDFVKFSKTYISDLEKNGRGSYARRLTSSLNNLIDFFKAEKILINDINSRVLTKFEEYLTQDRTLTRKDQFQNDVTFVKKGMLHSGRDTMTHLRTLFNAAKAEFNDEDQNDILITHSPFSKYKIKKPATQSAKRNLKPDSLALIRDYKSDENISRNYVQRTDRVQMGKDIFMLSLYLVGINTADLFNAEKFEHGRLIYNRTKTKRRRSDDALISIKIEPEAMEIIERYRDASGKKVFNFYQKYSTSKNFNVAVNEGLYKIAEDLKLGINLTTYYARHSWATIARNICRVSKDDIAFALNHVDHTNLVTDVYMEKDWKLIDEANRKVIDVINDVNLK